MKARMVGGAAALVALALATAATAGEAATQPIPVARVAVVKIASILKDYDYLKDCTTDLENRYKSQKERIENMQKNLETDRQKFLNDPMMRPGTPDFTRREMELKLAQTTFEQERMKLAREINKEQAAIALRFYDAYRNACARACQFYQVDILFSATESALPEEARQENVPYQAIMQEIHSRSVQYVSGQVDITQGVLHILNSTYRAYKQNPRSGLPMFPPPAK